ncbi:MAG: 16S rRNA processing protein RimM [Paludibacteraceae bacterium]|nr:16S rRNA processing protein RimM [Paludibacteraceae bacterium]
MIELADVCEIGRTHKPHGLGGEIACTFSDTRFDDAEAEFFVFDMDGILVPFYIESYRFKTETSALLKFVDLDSEAAVRPLADKVIYLHRRYQPEADAGEELTLSSLTGFTLIDRVLGPIGIVQHVDESTMNALFVLDNGHLIPANDALVYEVNYEQHQIFADLPEGLLELS